MEVQEEKGRNRSVVASDFGCRPKSLKVHNPYNLFWVGISPHCVQK